MDPLSTELPADQAKLSSRSALRSPCRSSIDQRDQVIRVRCLQILRIDLVSSLHQVIDEQSASNMSGLIEWARQSRQRVLATGGADEVENSLPRRPSWITDASTGFNSVVSLVEHRSENIVFWIPALNKNRPPSSQPPRSKLWQPSALHATFWYRTCQPESGRPDIRKSLEEAGLNPEILKSASLSSPRPPFNMRLKRLFSHSLLIQFGVLLILVGCLVSPSQAEVTLPQVLSSHMVIQRDLPVHVWGWAAAGETVTVSFQDQTQSTQAAEWGAWSIYLPPGAAGGPFVMNIKGSNSIKLDDVLVGDVWVASGQSNMEFQLRKAATAAADLPKTANSQIRLLLVKERTADYPQLDLAPTAWTVSSPDTAKDFSAVAWYFAREISQREHVPIGVIDSSVGGTIAESWTSLDALSEDASLAPVFATRGHMADREATELLKDKWRKRLQDEAKAQGKPDPAFPWHPPLNTWAPAMLFNAMIAPITPFPIRGVIWYQGESNSALERAPIYGRLFKAMIEDWRSQWKIGDFPFLYVQLANFTSTPLEVWAPIREAQRRALVLRNTGMAVTIDIGNPKDVHPTDKLTVGERLALAARSVAYGEQLESAGPLFRQITTEQASLRVWFDHASGLETRGGPLNGFEVAGDDGIFTPAEAAIDGNTVILTNSTVLRPVAARYGWANSPECHLYNHAGLPASPFTSVR